MQGQASPFSLWENNIPDEKAVVAIDGSGPATAALEYALSRFSTSDITVLHVLDVVDADNMRQEYSLLTVTSSVMRPNTRLRPS